MKHWKWVALVLIGILLLQAVVLAQTPPVNLLANPGFEGPTMPQDNIGQLQVVSGWRVAWKENQCQKPDWALDGSPPDKIRRPELKALPLAVDKRRVHGGTQSQCMFGFYSAMIASLQQTVSVPVGTWVQGWAYAQSWASEGDDPTTNVKSDMYALIGIDPEGEENPWARRVVWANWQYVPPSGSDAGNWVLLEGLPVQAKKDKVTMFILANGRWASKHVDIYIDDAKLQQVAAPGGENTPIPLPTYTPYPTPVPCPTCPASGECSCLTLDEAISRWGWLAR